MTNRPPQQQALNSARRVAFKLIYIYIYIYIYMRVCACTHAPVCVCVCVITYDTEMSTTNIEPRNLRFNFAHLTSRTNRRNRWKVMYFWIGFLSFHYLYHETGMARLFTIWFLLLSGCSYLLPTQPHS